MRQLQALLLQLQVRDDTLGVVDDDACHSHDRSRRLAPWARLHREPARLAVGSLDAEITVQAVHALRAAQCVVEPFAIILVDPALHDLRSQRYVGGEIEDAAEILAGPDRAGAR